MECHLSQMDSWKFQYYQRHDAGYEKARCSAVWNGRVPDRYPRLIVLPECEKDVCSIVKYARDNNLSIGTKSGGHSWTASFLREGGVFVDLAKMNKYHFDVESATAEAQPAAYGSDMNAELAPYGLMFPAGHCPTVGLGGFLLQGGFGWNSRNWGMACQSITAIDLVNADGELIHADDTQNSDYFWAARGAGCGYFGLVTKFYLRLNKLPQGIMTARYAFELEHLDEVVTSIDAVSADISSDLEVSLFVAHDQDGLLGRASVAITVDALSNSESEARKAMGVIDKLDVMRKAVKSDTYNLCTMRDLLKRYDDILDNRGFRYEANNIWTDSGAERLLTSFHEIAEHLPAAPSHLYMLWWLPSGSRPEMAFSMEGRLFISIYAISQDAAKDKLHSDYVVRAMTMMNEHRKGIQLADENLPAHPGKFMATPKYRRLEGLRQKYDPQGRFYGYMRVPPEFEEARASL